MIVGTKMRWKGDDRYETCVEIVKNDDGTFTYWFQGEGEDYRTFLHGHMIKTLVDADQVEITNDEATS